MVKEKEGREMLQWLIYCRMTEGKSFRNVNSVSNMDREMKSLRKNASLHDEEFNLYRAGFTR